MKSLILSLLLLAPAPALAGPLEGDWPASDRRVTLDVKDAPIADVLRAIADAGGFGLVLPAHVGRSPVTVSVKDAPVHDALEMVLAAQNLAATRKGDIVTIAERRGGFAVDEKTGGLKIGVRVGDDDDDDSPGGKHDRVKIGGSVVVEKGEDVGDAVAVGGSVTIRGRAHDAVAVGGDVTVGPGAEVRGDTVAVGGHLAIDPKATVGGDRVEVGPGAIPRRLIGALLGAGAAGTALGIAASVFGAVASFVVFFVLGLVLVALAPRRLDAVGDALARRPLRSALVGFGGWVGFVLVCVLLAITLIGIPLALIAALGFVAAIFFGMTALAVRLGRALPILGVKSGALALALGTLTLVVVRHVPVVGGVLVALAAMVCFGAMLITRWGGNGRPTTPPPAESPAETLVPPAG